MVGGEFHVVQEVEEVDEIRMLILLKIHTPSHVSIACRQAIG